MKPGDPFHDYSSRIAAGLAAAGGLLCAACVSGLPAVQCKALANLYGTEIELFGTAGFCGNAIPGGLALADSDNPRRHVRDSAFVMVFLVTGILFLLGGVIVSGLRLYTVIDQCCSR